MHRTLAFRAARQSALPLSRRIASANLLATFFARGPMAATVARPVLMAATKAIRSYSVLSEDPEATIYDYKKVKELVNNKDAHPDAVLVDVREPVEYNDGHIPSAINIPFKTSPGALGLSGDEFADQFGFQKPDANKELIFYCLAGVRSSAAEDLARTFGYKHRGNYVGSYEDWVTHENSKK